LAASQLPAELMKLKSSSPTIIPTTSLTQVPTELPTKYPTIQPTNANAPDQGCTERVQVWDETVADQTCNREWGVTDKSASATVCEGYEDYQHVLELSLANRMFMGCTAWCVYNLYERAYEAFIWRRAGCWEPSDKCISVFYKEREAMTDYVDNVLCQSNIPEPTFELTCTPELDYSEDLMDTLCTVSATGTTYKHYNSIHREPVACSGDLADTLDLKKSLANNLFDNCGAWCVFDWNTQAFDAWSWTPSGLCWSRKSDGFCFYDKTTKTQKQIWTDAKTKLASKCGFDASSTCYHEYSWTIERASELCTPTSYGQTSKSYSGVFICSGDGEKQTQLEKSLANKLYRSCDSWCVYNWDTLLDDEMGGYMWNNIDDCYRWVTKGACFSSHLSEYQAAREYMLETCSYLNSTNLTMPIQ